MRCLAQVGSTVVGFRVSLVLTMALSSCVVPLGFLRVGALRPATLAASVYLVVLFDTFGS